jgi:L-lactate dehydrogenase (cytochrome)
MRRSAPRPGEVWRFAAPVFRRQPGGRLARVRTTEDFERLARRRTPGPVFDYVAGAAEDERSAGRAVEAFNRVVFHPHVLRDVSAVDPTTTVLGRSIAMPIVLGPTGFTRMMRAEGEPAVARAAGRAGVPYALSTLGTTSIERLAAQAPDAERWFQLYVWRDRGRSKELIQAAAAHGYTTLVLTVDVPVAGARLRDVRAGLTIPPTLSARTLLAIARKPRWLFDNLTTEPLAFESLGASEELMSLINKVFDPAVTLADIQWLRAQWDGNIVVKGVQRVDDAKEIASAGIDGIAVSNHGGRQLDRAVSPLDVLRDIADNVADQVEVYLDGGVRSGADVAAAVALGARAAFVARPYLYALMAAGEPGVEHLLQILHDDYVRTLQLLGVASTAQLTADLVTAR